MRESHLAYLSLGSNIEPEENLPKAVHLLSTYGDILKLSGVWESEPVGTAGPNYLNICVLFKSPYPDAELKKKVIKPIEQVLGRVRGEDKYAARSMDIDVIVFDGQPVGEDWQALAYVVVPLAEVYPEFKLTSTEEKISETATRLRQVVWMETRQGILG